MAMLRKSVGRHCTCQKTLTLIARNLDKLHILFFSGRDLMTNTKQANKPAALKSPAKLKPRVADPQAATSQESPAAAPAAATADVAPVLEAVTQPDSQSAQQTTAKPASASAAAKVRKPSAVDQTVAKHQKALADALEKAEAISYDPPQAPKAGKAAKPVKAEKPAKIEKPVKPKKTKLIRDSYAMPEQEYAQIAGLKKRLSGLGNEVKKSELLRCGVAVLAALNDVELQAVVGRVERIKTGRPSKK
jgi:hypothetical protein